MKLETEKVYRTKEEDGTLFQCEEQCYVFNEIDLKLFLIDIISDVAIRNIRKEKFTITDYLNNLFKD